MSQSVGDWTPAETAAIRSLRRLAKKWPDTIGLFGASGTLYVTRRDTWDPNNGVPVASIIGIHGDGGDPHITHTEEDNEPQ